MTAATGLHTACYCVCLCVMAYSFVCVCVSWWGHHGHHRYAPKPAACGLAFTLCMSHLFAWHISCFINTAVLLCVFLFENCASEQRREMHGKLSITIVQVQQELPCLYIPCASRIVSGRIRSTHVSMCTTVRQDPHESSVRADESQAQ